MRPWKSIGGTLYSWWRSFELKPILNPKKAVYIPPEWRFFSIFFQFFLRPWLHRDKIPRLFRIIKRYEKPSNNESQSYGLFKKGIFSLQTVLWIKVTLRFIKDLDYLKDHEDVFEQTIILRPFLDVLQNVKWWFEKFSGFRVCEHIGGKRGNQIIKKRHWRNHPKRLF